MKRREFLKVIGAAAAWPAGAEARLADRVRRISWLDSFREDDPNALARVKAFQEEIGKFGWAVGRNLVIDYRWNLFDLESARLAGAELLKLAPDVMLCGGTPSALAMKQATSAVPIVFAFVTDPIAQGIVPSLSRPGSNVTGFAYMDGSVGAKWLELLKEAAPKIKRVTVMFNPVSSPYSSLYYQSIVAAAPKIGVDTVTALVREFADVEQVLEKLGREPDSGVIFSSDAFLYANRKLITELAARHQLPAMYGMPGTAADGGLIYYCVDIVDMSQKAAGYIDRILRGEKPSDLPVQQPTKFEMTVNLTTAKALGLTIPQSILLRADEVIE